MIRLYVPPGHYVATTIDNRQYVTRAYPLPDAEQLAALFRLAKHVARGDLAPDILRSRARYLAARIESARLDAQLDGK